MTHLQLLPAVDVADGQAVRLVQGVAGSERVVRRPAGRRPPWQDAGAEWLHLVDLDAAFGRGSNRELPAEIVAALDVQVELSGGIRDDESLEAALATGCARVNIGTAALEDPEWCAKVIAEHGDRIAVGLDVRGTHPGRPRLDPRGRRPLRDARPARRRGLRPLRRHRRHQGRHAARPQPRAAARGLRRAPTARSSPPAASPPSTTCGRCATLVPRRGRGRHRRQGALRGPFTLEEALALTRGGGMSLAVRVIPCLDVDAGRVVKGVNFQELRDAGDPVELARPYDAEGADELTFLDITASHEGRETTYDVVSRTRRGGVHPAHGGRRGPHRRRRRPAAARRRRQGGGQHRRDRAGPS